MRPTNWVFAFASPNPERPSWPGAGHWTRCQASARCSDCFEGVCTGAADGYARVSGHTRADVACTWVRDWPMVWPICTTPAGRIRR